MAVIHKLDTNAFRKKRIYWLFLMILPSFIVDAVIVYRIITMHPAILDASGMLDIGEILMLFLTNALLLKSEGIIVYYVLKGLRKNSEVCISPKRVIYRKKLLVGYTFYFNYRIYAEYSITAPKAVTIRRNGSVVIKGDIPVVYFMLNGTDVHSKGIKHRCVIPGYFNDMDNTIKKLKCLAVSNTNVNRIASAAESETYDDN